MSQRLYLVIEKFKNAFASAGGMAAAAPDWCENRGFMASVAIAYASPIALERNLTKGAVTQSGKIPLAQSGYFSDQHSGEQGYF